MSRKATLKIKKIGKNKPAHEATGLVWGFKDGLNADKHSNAAITALTPNRIYPKNLPRCIIFISCLHQTSASFLR